MLGLVLAVRPGGEALSLACVAVLGDGIAMLAAVLPPAAVAVPVSVLSAAALLMPALLLVGRATLGRAGGIGGA